VHTSDVRGAGTDAAVSVQLFGPAGASSGQHELLAGPGAFERARVDRFSLVLQDVGPLQKLAIGHDGSGSSSAWHLEKVVVTPEGGKVRGRPPAGWLGCRRAWRLWPWKRSPCRRLAQCRSGPLR
jgi:hypothetical protein